MSLLALVMIVKDEARSILATLDSVRGAVDRVVILDTGSTDGTQDLVRAFDGAAVVLHEEPFVDFASTRNRALELAGEASTFTLMLSGDETLHGGRELRRFCERRARAADGAYHVRVQLGGEQYDSARLARAAAGWRYVGVTHEVLCRSGERAASIRVPGARVAHDISHRDAASQRRKWERDLALLTAEIGAREDDVRSWFYLAQTLECLEDFERAQRAYEQRVRLGGWQEEVYESLFRLGRVDAALGRPWLEVQQRYLAAAAHSPHRPEPLLAIAKHYQTEQAWPLAYRFASWGAALPFPDQAMLFVDPEARDKLLDVLAVAAFQVGAFGAGEAAVREAIARKPADPRLRANLDHYKHRRRPMSEPRATTSPTAKEGQPA